MPEAHIESRDGEIIPLVDVTVSGDLIGVFLRMSVRQQFRNPTDHPLEITYSFPLPYAAVLLQAEIHMRDRVFQSQISEAPSARARYDKSITAGDTAILITHDADFYTMRLGNVPAGEDVVIHIRYGEWLTPNDGMVRVSLPTTIAPRYGAPPAHLTPDQVPVTDVAVQYPFSYTLHIHECTVAQVSVPSHVARIEANDDGVAVAIAGASMDRDVVVQVQGYGAYRATMMAKHQRQYWHSTYLTIPHTAEVTVVQSMHIKLLIDCSGSMSGTSIEQARQAVVRLLGMLRDGDSIAVTRFGSRVVDVTPGLMKVGATVRKQMNAWVKTIDANLGGTETAQAIRYVLDMPTHDQPCDIVVLTDGEAWGIREVAAQATASGHRVFPVVIGYTPSDGDLQVLATQTGGFCEVVTPNERIDEAIGRITRRLQAQTAQNVSLSFGDAVVAWECGTIPRYSGDTSLVVTVTDRAADAHFSADAHQQTLASISVPAPMVADFVRTLAAKRLDSMAGESQTKWAVTHQLVAPGTALVAVAAHEADAKVTGNAIKAVVMQEMAYGWHGREHVHSSPIVAYSLMPAIDMAPPMPALRVRTSNKQTTASFSASSSHLPDVDASDVADDTQLPRSPAPRHRSTPTDYVWPEQAHVPAHDAYIDMAQNAVVLIGTATPTFAHLRQAGLSADIIDALQAIAGYSEAQIVAAVITTVLGTQTWSDPALRTLPAALLGGVKIILTTA